MPNFLGGALKWGGRTHFLAKILSGSELSECCSNNALYVYNAFPGTLPQAKVIKACTPIPRNTQIIPIGNAPSVINTIFIKFFEGGIIMWEGKRGQPKEDPFYVFVPISPSNMSQKTFSMPISCCQSPPEYTKFPS